jgi:hypothetical protein
MARLPVVMLAMIGRSPTFVWFATGDRLHLQARDAVAKTPISITVTLHYRNFSDLWLNAL